MVVVGPTPTPPPLMGNVSATQVSLATLGSELLLRRTNRRGGGGCLLAQSTQAYSLSHVPRDLPWVSYSLRWGLVLKSRCLMLTCK